MGRNDKEHISNFDEQIGLDLGVFGLVWGGLGWFGAGNHDFCYFKNGFLVPKPCRMTI